MAKGDLLGKIDCPCCGTQGGMRVTEDKNGAPFGYCDATCNTQLRVGGSAYRVDHFYRKYPHVKRPGVPVTVTDTGEGDEPESPVTVPVPGLVKNKVPDYLAMLGVR